MAISTNLRSALIALVAISSVALSAPAAGADDPVIRADAYERRVSVLEQIAADVDRELRAVAESRDLILAQVGTDLADAGSLARRLDRLRVRRSLLGREIEAIGFEMREAPPVSEPASDGVDRWRALVGEHFPAARVEDAMSIMDCESGGDPLARNPRSGASGLFQFLPRTWDFVAAQAGVADLGAEDGAANIAAAAWLTEHSVAAGDNAWAHWTCRP
jgi:hypothetical protein